MRAVKRRTVPAERGSRWDSYRYLERRVKGLLIGVPVRGLELDHVVGRRRLKGVPVAYLHTPGVKEEPQDKVPTFEEELPRKETPEPDEASRTTPHTS